VKHLCSIILRITLYALLPALLPVTDSACCRLSQHTTYCLRFVLIPLLTAYCILPAVLFAQAGWGPDVRLTYFWGYSYDPRAVCCGDTVHLVWWEHYGVSGQTREEVFYKRSTDAGETWEADLRLTPEDSITAVLPIIAIWGSNVHVVWKEQTAYYQAICYRKSENSGETWGSIDTIYKTNQDGWYHPWISAHDSNLFVVAIKSGTGGELVFVKSTNNGISWSTPQIITSAQDRPRIKNFKTDAVFLVVAYGDGTEIYSVRSFTAGEVWTDSQVVSEFDSISSQCPAMDTDDSAGIHITWYDYKYSPYPWTGDIFYRASRDTGNTWEPIDSLTTQHRARHSDILAEENNLHLVWDDDRNGFGENEEIYYRMSTDLGQTWGNEVRLTDALCHSNDPSLACDDNYLHLFWSDRRDDSNNIVGEIYYKRKDLSQGVVELESLVPTLHLWFELCPTLFSKVITIRYSAWSKGQWGLNQARDNPAMPYALCAKVYDITGKEVMKKEETVKGENGVVVQIDTEDLPCGVYFVELQADNVREVHKVVKIK
jgi:hypothetical protein